MVAAIPVSKATEIRDILSSFIDNSEQISEFDIKRYDREISRLPHPFEKDELKAFLLAAQGKNDDAIAQFERAIRMHAEYSTVCNFCIFLKRINRMYEAKQAYCMYHRWFDDYQMLSSALAFLGYSGDVDGVELCTKKLIGILGQDSEECSKVIDIRNEFIDLYGLAEKNSQLSLADIDKLTNVALKVADNHKVPHTDSQFVFADSTLAFIISVKNQSSDKLADLNIDASFALADNDDLLGKNVSVVFRDVLDN